MTNRRRRGQEMREDDGKEGEREIKIGKGVDVRDIGVRSSDYNRSSYYNTLQHDGWTRHSPGGTFYCVYGRARCTGAGGQGSWEGRP